MTHVTMKHGMRVRSGKCGDYVLASVGPEKVIPGRKISDGGQCTLQGGWGQEIYHDKRHRPKYRWFLAVERKTIFHAFDLELPSQRIQKEEREIQQQKNVSSVSSIITEGLLKTMTTLRFRFFLLLVLFSLLLPGIFFIPVYIFFLHSRE